MTLFPKSSLVFLTSFFPEQPLLLNQILLNFNLGLEVDTRQEVIFDRLFTYKIITSPIHTLVTSTFCEVIFRTLNFILSILIFVSNEATSNLILYHLMSQYFLKYEKAKEKK